MLNSFYNVLDRIKQINVKIGSFQQTQYNNFAERAEQRDKFNSELKKSIDKLSMDKVELSGEAINKTQTMKYNTSNQPYAALIEKASRKYSVPEELIKAVIKQESNFKADAVSSKGATGLMQLMPKTAESLSVNDIYDPEENIDAGTRYLGKMINQFDGNIFRALAAYNAGPQNIIDNEIPDYKETKDYIDKVVNYYKLYSEK